MPVRRALWVCELRQTQPHKGVADAVQILDIAARQRGDALLGLQPAAVSPGLRVHELEHIQAGFWHGLLSEQI